MPGRAAPLLFSLLGCVTPPQPDPLPPECRARADSEAKTASNGKRGAQPYHHGLQAAATGDHQTALQAFAQALATDPDHADAHLAKAKSHLQFDGDTEAIRHHLNQTIIRAPQNAEAQGLFANVLAHANDHEGATAHYRCALHLDPSRELVRVDLAAQLLQRGDFLRAEAELRQVRAQNLRTRSLLALALEGQGKLQAAAEVIKTAAEDLQTSPVLYRRAADLFARAQVLDQAEEMRAKADAIDPPPARRKMRPLVKARRRSRRHRR